MDEHADRFSRLARAEPWIRGVLDRLIAKNANPFAAAFRVILFALLAALSLWPGFVWAVWSWMSQFLPLPSPPSLSDPVQIAVLATLGVIACVCLVLSFRIKTARPYSALTVSPVDDFHDQFSIPEDQRNEYGGQMRLNFRLRVLAPFQDVVLRDLEMRLYHPDGRCYEVDLCLVRVWQGGTSRDHRAGQRGAGDLARLQRGDEIEIWAHGKAFAWPKEYPDAWNRADLRILLSYTTDGARRRKLRQLDYKLEARGVSRRFRPNHLMALLLDRPVAPPAARERRARRRQA